LYEEKEFSRVRTLTIYKQTQRQHRVQGGGSIPEIPYGSREKKTGGLRKDRGKVIVRDDRETKMETLFPVATGFEKGWGAKSERERGNHFMRRCLERKRFI